MLMKLSMITLSFMIFAHSPIAKATDIPESRGAYLQEIVIQGPGAAGATYTTGSGMTIPGGVKFQDGTPVNFVPTTTMPRAPAAEPGNAGAPVPYNVMDYRENPLDKAQYYFPNPIK